MSHRHPTPALRMRTVRTVAELRSALAPARRAGAHDRPGADDGRAARGAPVAASAAPASSATWWSCRCSSTPRSSTSARTSSATRATSSATPSSPPAAGADLLFAPRAEEVYPPGFATTVEVLGRDRAVSRAKRAAAEHFRGVATVVTKLLCMALPDVAYFGQKDAQQVLVIRRLVADLNLPVRIEALPTVREPDGLALSSRNALLLRARARARARRCPRRSSAARASWRAAGERSAQALLDAAREALPRTSVEPEYVALVDPDTLEPIEARAARRCSRSPRASAQVRLIDNVTLHPAAGARTANPHPGEAIATCSA